jgi:hypothetical protein
MGRTRMRKYPGFMEVGLDMPVLVADEDFIEYLHELSYVDEIELHDLVLEWVDWAKENIDE